MKSITLPIAELKPALTGLGKVINARATLPVLHHVKVERTSEGWIALTGTDLDRFITMRLEHPAEGPPMAVLIPYDQLQQIVKTCGRDESIHVEPGPDGAVIKFALADKLGESKVKPLPVAEFPSTPRIKSDAIVLPPEIRRSIHEAMDCASTDSTRHVLNGTFIDTSNPKANYIVGTDGKHLYSANSFALPLKHSLIIPSHKFLGWKDFNLDGEWQMRADDQQLQISSRRWRFISKTIEGTYPNWRQVVPSPHEAKTNITIDPARLETLVRLIQRMPGHDDRFHTIGLEWKQGQFLLLGKETSAEPWLRVPVPDIQGEGPEVTIFLDRRFLIKALQFGLNTLSLMDPMSPLRFSQAEKKQMIVMPLRGDSTLAPATTPSQPPATTMAAVTTTTTSPPPAEQPNQTPPMQTHTQTNGQPHPAGANGSTTAASTTDKQDTKTALEAALVQVEGIKTSFREAINGLTKLGDSIRNAMREQKASEKEVHNVRQTLRSLQGVRL